MNIYPNIKDALNQAKDIYDEALLEFAGVPLAIYIVKLENGKGNIYYGAEYADDGTPEHYFRDFVLFADGSEAEKIYNSGELNVDRYDNDLILDLDKIENKIAKLILDANIFIDDHSNDVEEFTDHLHKALVDYYGTEIESQFLFCKNYIIDQLMTNKANTH
jgi:hypothetical protein